MGHTRLGAIPKTRKWSEVGEYVAGGSMAGPVSVASDMAAIAAKTLDAAQAGLDRAVTDLGVRYTFYLMTQVAFASRKSDWEAALGRHGIRLSQDANAFELTVEVQAAIDRYVGRRDRLERDRAAIGW